MKQAVYKYPLLGPGDAIPTETVVMMPPGAQPLSVGIQGDQVMLWALVMPDVEPVARAFVLLGTGHESELNEGSRQDFVGTVQMRGRWQELVVHVFDLGEVDR